MSNKVYDSPFELVKEVIDSTLELNGNKGGYPIATGYLEGKLGSLLRKIKDIDPDLYEQECSVLSERLTYLNHLIKYPHKEEL